MSLGLEGKVSEFETSSSIFVDRRSKTPRGVSFWTPQENRVKIIFYMRGDRHNKKLTSPDDIKDAGFALHANHVARHAHDCAKVHCVQWRVAQHAQRFVGDHATGRHPDHLGRVVECPLEHDLGQVGLDGAVHLHQFMLRDAIHTRLDAAANGSI